MHPWPKNALPIAIKLHKVINDHDNVLSFEHVTVMDQIVWTRRQKKFQMVRKFTTKIGMNTTANKLYHLNNLVSLDMLNLKFVHYKKIIKIQFLKNGKTWTVNWLKIFRNVPLLRGSTYETKGGWPATVYSKLNQWNINHMNVMIENTLLV